MAENVVPVILTPISRVRAFGLYPVPPGWRGALLRPARQPRPPMTSRLAAATPPATVPGTAAQPASDSAALTSSAAAGTEEHGVFAAAAHPSAATEPAAGPEGSRMDPAVSAANAEPAFAVIGDVGPGLHVVPSGERWFRCYRVAVWQSLLRPKGEGTALHGQLELWLRLANLTVALAHEDPVAELVRRVDTWLASVPADHLAAAPNAAALDALLGPPQDFGRDLGLDVRFVAYRVRAARDASAPPEPPPGRSASDERSIAATLDDRTARLERELAALRARGYPPPRRHEYQHDGSAIYQLDLAGPPRISVCLVVPSRYPAEPAGLVPSGQVDDLDAAWPQAPRSVHLVDLVDTAVEQAVLHRLKQLIGGRG